MHPCDDLKIQMDGFFPDLGFRLKHFFVKKKTTDRRMDRLKNVKEVRKEGMTQGNTERRSNRRTDGMSTEGRTEGRREGRKD